LASVNGARLTTKWQAAAARRVLLRNDLFVIHLTVYGVTRPVTSLTDQ
jgi:hypothetical protein